MRAFAGFAAMSIVTSGAGGGALFVASVTLGVGAVFVGGVVAVSFGVGPAVAVFVSLRVYANTAAPPSTSATATIAPITLPLLPFCAKGGTDSAFVFAVAGVDVSVRDVTEGVDGVGA